MKPENWISLAQFAFTAAALFIGPWWAVRRSIAQFHEQKIWEKQVETYQQLISDISHLYEDYSDNFQRAVTDQKPSELSSELKEARTRLERHANCGGFIVSERAGETIRKALYSTDPSRYGSYAEYYDGAAGGLKENLAMLIRCAKDQCQFSQ